MGSHGGATAEGQRAVLEEYGITEEHAWAVPSSRTWSRCALGRTASGVPVFMDRNAWAADGVIVVGRVKPHTSFRAPVESGLCKMMAVGLGKQRGAEALHQFGLGPVIEEAGAGHPGHREDRAGTGHRGECLRADLPDGGRAAGAHPRA